MYKPHEICTTPENQDVHIWRYMDFTKFISLIDRRALFFPRVRHLRHLDSFEGSYSKITLDHALSPAPNPLLADFDHHIVVNSWHINDSESMAMWDLYLRERPGVAIRSTFRRLADSFSCTGPDVLIGNVYYIDHLNEVMPAHLLKDGFNGLVAYMCKRKSFVHEAELRCLAIAQEQPGGVQRFFEDGGVYMPVDLDNLIEEVVVSPKAPRWFRDLVNSVILKYEIKKPVRASITDELPLDLRATDKTPLEFKCPTCKQLQQVDTEASKIQDNPDGTTIVYFARSITMRCIHCGSTCIVELKVENKSAATNVPEKPRVSEVGGSCTIE